MDLLNLLTRLLIWIAVGWFIWWSLTKFIPKSFLTWFGGAIILAIIAMAFIYPNDDSVNATWQVISFPLKPLGASLVLLLVAMSKGLKKVDGRMVLIAFIILFISSIPLVARTIVNQAEDAVALALANQRQLCSDICPAIDQVPVSLVGSMVVIGDNIDADRLSYSLPSRTNLAQPISPALAGQLDSAVDAYGRLNGALPFVTVTAGPSQSNAEEQERLEFAIRQELTTQGIPPDRIRIIAAGTSIRRAAVDQREFLLTQGLISEELPDNNRDANRVVLVAPAMTMRRAALTFERLGMQVVAWPTDLYGEGGPNRGDRLARLADLVPTVGALQLTTRYWNELLTSFYYFLRNWLPPFNVQWSEVVETIPQ
jgi:uncharacterized SAM-binding protein YcdF (DUF218 family)